MLLFNCVFLWKGIKYVKISIHLMLLFNVIELYRYTQLYNFNTSNVTIQPSGLYELSLINLHFNTSNVTIQRQAQIKNHLEEQDFNTSNVTIQQLIFPGIIQYKKISIHLMLLFNVLSQPSPFELSLFQYI